jgi:UDP-3-O-[3-hydroxymyristoyl] glucosamine N-acyltransferase
MNLTLGEIIAATGLTFENGIERHLNTSIYGPWNNVEATPPQITFLTRQGQKTKAGFAIVDDLKKIMGNPTTGLVHPHPYYAMAKIAQLWHFKSDPREIRGSVLTVTYDHVRIPHSAKIWSNVVLGADGFGFVRTPSGSYMKFPHLGDVIIGENVEIFPHVNISRGTLSNTVIGAGTKIDTLVHIAHNVHIGMDCMIVAGAEISGSVSLGNNVWVGPNASIIQGAKVGDGATIGIGAVVLRDVAAGETIVGHHRVIESKDDQSGVIR